MTHCIGNSWLMKIIENKVSFADHILQVYVL